MSTVQVVGIAIAVVILIVLVISLIVTRRKGTAAEPKREPEAPVPAEDVGSFLDEAPRDELHMLGKQDAPSPASAPPATWQSPAEVMVAEAPTQVEPTATAEESTAEIPAEQPAEAAEPAAPEALLETTPPVEATAPVAEEAALATAAAALDEAPSQEPAAVEAPAQEPATEPAALAEEEAEAVRQLFRGMRG